MQNFLLYYTKQNHIKAHELKKLLGFYETIEPIDEPFFVIGIYLNQRKFTASSLTPYEQSYCLSDYNNLSNVQPNYFRDAHTNIVFYDTELTLSSNGNGYISKFTHPVYVASKTSTLNKGSFIQFVVQIPTQSVTVLQNDSIELRPLLRINGSVLFVMVSDLYMIFKGETKHSLEYIYYPESNTYTFNDANNELITLLPTLDDFGQPCHDMTDSDSMPLRVYHTHINNPIRFEPNSI